MEKFPPVNCILDCLSYSIQNQKMTSSDHFSLYFGIWDEQVELDKSGNMTHYNKSIVNSNYIDRFKLLYGLEIEKSIIDIEDRGELYTTVMMNRKKHPSYVDVLIMVDLFYLPYPNKCYNARHSQHFVLLEKIDELGWHIIDPFFSWKGYISTNDMHHGLGYGKLFVQYYYNSNEINVPTISAINSIYRSGVIMKKNVLVQEIGDMLDKVIESDNNNSLSSLLNSMYEVLILLKRKNAYYYTIAFLEGNNTKNKEVNFLLKGWENFTYQVMRIAMLNEKESLIQLKARLGELDLLELKVKDTITNLYSKWIINHN